jgi:hypothetical protein
VSCSLKSKPEEEKGRNLPCGEGLRIGGNLAWGRILRYRRPLRRSAFMVYLNT